MAAAFLFPVLFQLIAKTAQEASVFTGGELLGILVLAMSPAFIAPMPIFIDLYRRNGAPSYVPYFVMAFWTLAAVLPMALSAAGILDRAKMMYGGYGLAAQVFLVPAFLFPLFFLSAYIFALAFGVRHTRVFFGLWLGVAFIMIWPWTAFAFYGL